MKVSIVFYLQENHIKIDSIIFFIVSEKQKLFMDWSNFFFITVETSEIFDFFFLLNVKDRN